MSLAYTATGTENDEANKLVVGSVGRLARPQI